jgi:polyisoprenoid-binding protein YceI
LERAIVNQGKRLGVLVFALLFPLSTLAAPLGFPLDFKHASIRFAVSYLWFSKVTGHFKDFSGTFTVDDENIANCAVALTINTNSVDTQHDATNARLRGEDFFNVEKFPVMSFSSTAVERTGNATAKMTGDLTLRGVTKPITLDITMNQEPDAQSTEAKLTSFTAHGVIKRSDFGMESMLWAVGDIIELNIEAEATDINPADNLSEHE